MEVEMAQTMWFVGGLVMRVGVVLVLRTREVPWKRGSGPSIGMVLVSGFVVTVGIVLPYILRVATYLGLVPPGGLFWGVLAGTLVMYCLVVQGFKVVYKVVFGKWL